MVNGGSQSARRGLRNWNAAAGRYPADVFNINNAARNLLEIIANDARNDAGDYQIRIYTIGMGELVRYMLGTMPEKPEDILTRIANDARSPDFNKNQLEGKYYYARLSGFLDRAELNAMTEEVERLEDAGVMIDRITDLTPLDRIDVGFEEVFAVAQRRAERKVAAPIKSALVANRPVQFGFARMFQMLNDNPRIQIRIFGNLEEAQQWLHSSRR